VVRSSGSVVVLDYDDERHKFYSLKDVNKFKYKQDIDLVPNYAHSDYSALLSEWKTHRLTAKQITKNKEYILTKTGSSISLFSARAESGFLMRLIISLKSQ